MYKFADKCNAMVFSHSPLASKYRIVIQEQIDLDWSDYSRDSTTIHDRKHTILTGSYIDQSALHGLIERIRDLNLVLLSVELLDKNGATLFKSGEMPNRK